MQITINVNVTGLEPLLAVLERFVSINPAASPAPAAPVPQAPPQQYAPAPVMTGATAPALTVVPAPGPTLAYSVPPGAAPAPVEAVPVAAPATYTQEQLAVAAMQLMDAGRQAELVSLLGSFGVQALTELPKEQYGNFATQLRAMGAKL